jgi:hypothetical protein
MVMKIKHFPILDTNKVIEYYNQKDNVAISYVCTTDLNSDDSPADIFYRKTPHPDFDNRYFALRMRNNKAYISNADTIELLTFGMVEDDGGNLQYSQFHHDYKGFGNGNMIDGGRNYTRSSGKVIYYVVRDGELTTQDNVV